MNHRARGISLFLSAIFVAASVQASDLQYLGTDSMTVHDLMTALRKTRDDRRLKSGVGPQIVTIDSTDDSFIIPVVGSVMGGGGTFFKSDVTIANRRSATQIISVGYLARSVDNTNAPLQNFSINANATVVQSDFVGFLGKTGLGTLLVVGRTSTGAIDTNASIDGFSRIWTPQPGSAGTVSQAFESFPINDSLPTSYGYGLRQDGSFRTNVGLVNVQSAPNQFTINIVGTNGNTSFVQAVQPYSMEQVPIPAGNWGDLYLRIDSAATNFNFWTAYGTSVDNVTGDGWVSHVH